MPFEAKCGNCGGKFERASRPDDRPVYCSRPCYWASMKKPVITTCKGCGVQFDPHDTPRKKAKLSQVYCTPECYAQDRTRVLERWLAEAEELYGPDGCWPWPHGKNKNGYGIITRGYKQDLVHRAVYEILVGPIPDDMTLDHMCHQPEECAGGKTCPHRACANPAHLGVATSLANAQRGNVPSSVNRRKRRCKDGHALAGINLYVTPRGYRQCRICQARREREYRERKRAAAAADRPCLEDLITVCGSY